MSDEGDTFYLAWLFKSSRWFTTFHVSQVGVQLYTIDRLATIVRY